MMLGVHKMLNGLLQTNKRLGNVCLPTQKSSAEKIFTSSFCHAAAALSSNAFLGGEGRTHVRSTVKRNILAFQKATSSRYIQPSPFFKLSHVSRNGGVGQCVTFKPTNGRQWLQSGCGRSSGKSAWHAGSSQVLVELEDEELQSGIDDDMECPELYETTITVQGRTISIVQPTDVDQVVDMYIKQGRMDREPYWCRLWPSAVALAEEILVRPELVRGRVCDLGAGLGLAGLAAALVGSREVVFLDREHLALRCALLTAHANIPHVRSNLPLFLPLGQPLPPPPSASATPRGRPPVSAPFPGSPTVRAEVFDWADKSVQGLDFDTVLACDVLYEKPDVTLIADLVPRLLKNGGGSRLLIADPVERNPQHRAEFIRLMVEQQGMALERKEQREVELEGHKQNIVVMSFLAKGSSEEFPW